MLMRSTDVKVARDLAQLVEPTSSLCCCLPNIHFVFLHNFFRIRYNVFESPMFSRTPLQVLILIEQSAYKNACSLYSYLCSCSCARERKWECVDFGLRKFSRYLPLTDSFNFDENFFSCVHMWQKLARTGYLNELTAPEENKRFFALDHEHGTFFVSALFCVIYLCVPWILERW